jgi:SAM-dependent methyltransferase
VSLIEKFYPETRFGGFTHLDGTISFYIRVRALLKPEFVVLDLGCGRGAHAEDPVEMRRSLRNFKGQCAQVIGMDVDPAAIDNPFLDRFVPIADGKLPLESGTIDLCVSDYVLEHIEVPDQYFSEIFRVLKPGGYLCLRTANRIGYVAIIARFTRSRWHRWILSKAMPTRKFEDVFPTFYRCNTTRRLSRALRSHGFDAAVFGYESEPAYFSFSKFFYRLGAWHQKLAPNFLKLSIFAFAQKRFEESSSVSN